MSAVELKHILIHKISAINDVSFLKAIQTIIDSKMNHEILPLTNAERDEIMASQKEIEKGLFVDDEKLDDEIRTRNPKEPFFSSQTVPLPLLCKTVQK